MKLFETGLILFLISLSTSIPGRAETRSASSIRSDELVQAIQNQAQIWFYKDASGTVAFKGLDKLDFPILAASETTWDYLPRTKMTEASATELCRLLGFDRSVFADERSVAAGRQVIVLPTDSPKPSELALRPASRASRLDLSNLGYRIESLLVDARPLHVIQEQGATVLSAVSCAPAKPGGYEPTPLEIARQTIRDEIELRPSMRIWLKTFLDLLMEYPAEGEMSATLHDLVARGLYEDIEKSPYVFSEKCTESETGLEKDASTLRGVRNAPICINLPRLARLAKDTGLRGALAGLLMHEHARHFGLEDTTPEGWHPLGVYTADRVWLFGIGRIVYDRPGRADFNTRFLGMYEATALTQNLKFKVEKPSYPAHSTWITLFSTRPEGISLTVTDLEGNCPQTLNWRPADSGRRVEKLVPGVTLPWTEDYSFRTEVATDCRYRLVADTPEGRVTLPGVFSASESVTVRFHSMDFTDRHPVR